MYVHIYEFLVTGHIVTSCFVLTANSVVGCSREMAIEALSERLDNLILSEESSEEPEEYDEIPRPSISRRPRRLTRSRHIDIRSFFAPGTVLLRSVNASQ